MRGIIVASELTALLFVAVLLFGMVFENKIVTRKQKLFRALTISIMVTLLIDALSWFLDPFPLFSYLAQLFNVLSLIMGQVETTFFAYYVVAHVNEIRPTRFRMAHITCGLNVLVVIGTIVFSIMGKTYTLINGVYEFGPWYPYIGFMTAAVMLYVAIYIILQHKTLGIHDTIAFLIYCAVPIVASFVEAIFVGVEFAYVAAALSLGVIYALLQSKEIAEVRLKEQVSTQASMIDPLTGLKNRRAEDAFMDMLVAENAAGNMGVAFCDLNGLKYMNDNFGHAAGDEFITRFAELAKKEFPYDYIYRISGDEFTVLLPDITYATFEMQMASFRRLVATHGQIAAIGYAHGPKTSMEKLISEAEKDMYKEKTAYYQRTGRDRRR